ncbi:unnamed protein product [Colias eurytheme]|nr:unnamed protein product [Colias eurytheme]
MGKVQVRGEWREGKGRGKGWRSRFLSRSLDSSLGRVVASQSGGKVIKITTKNNHMLLKYRKLIPPLTSRKELHVKTKGQKKR